MSKHFNEAVEGDDGGLVICRGCKASGTYAALPSGECPTPYKPDSVLLKESLAREQALQQRLTAADERADTMEGLLRLARGAIGENKWTLLTKDIDTMLSQDAQRTNNSRNAHCPHDGICHTSEETCADAQARIASLTAPAGAGP